ncbi:MAG: GNAT family N-acetyltransferase [Chitinivibrionales bacterium]|nr:GNAT family N-acetyltransferase [Chitinivibrionales bacterium]
MAQYTEKQQWHFGEYLISTDKTLLDRQSVYDFLHNQSYWALDRTMNDMETSIIHSLCFGVYLRGSQVGFSRVVTDYATHAWICDVFIHPAHRAQGLGRHLVECMIGHPLLKSVKTMYLATKDAQKLYERYGGFQLLDVPERFMVRRRKLQT